MDESDIEEKPVVDHTVGDSSLTPTTLRSFVRGTGAMFQAVGVIWLFSACGLWSISGHLIEPVTHPPPQWLSYLTGEYLPASLLTIAMAVSVVGGLGLSAVGLGLQGERPSSGRAALIVCGFLAVAFWTLAFSFVVLAGQWVGGGLAAMFGLISTIFVLMAWRCAYEIRRDPPPDDSVVTEEFLEKHRRERAERLSKYDP